MDETKIIRKCHAGKLEEFGQLYDKYIKKIYDFIYYKTQHKETAEDLTSQSFMKALEKINSFDTEKGTFQAWMYQIARNTVIDHYRTRKSDANIEDVWDLSGDEDLERDLDTKEQLEKVEKYIAKLKPEQRDIIIMRVWQGMNYKEIAEVMDKSEASCKMMFSRVIRQLRTDMPMILFLSLLLFR